MLFMNVADRIALIAIYLHIIVVILLKNTDMILRPLIVELFKVYMQYHPQLPEKKGVL